jgi:hypothetical protein
MSNFLNQIADKFKALVSLFLTINGTTFAGLREYTNQAGEVANYVINLGFSYANAITNSIEILESLTAENFTAIAEKTGLCNVSGNQYSYNAKGLEFLASGKLPKEGTKARELVLKSVLVSMTLEQVRNEMIADYNNPSKQGTAQSEAYEYVCPSIKRHIENDTYHIWGMINSKVVLTEGVYADSIQKQVTKQKNAIKYFCKHELKKQLPTTKYRNFIVDKALLTSVAFKNNELVIT